jgi:hypothetical protein
MRTLLLFAPTLICVGTMVLCARMMSKGRRTGDAREAPSPREPMDSVGPTDLSGEPENR